MVVNGSHVKTDTFLQPAPVTSPASGGVVKSDEPVTCLTGTNTYRLEELAYLRSGDKGNAANIGKNCPKR